MTRLCFWYGVKFEDRGQAYSFLPESKIVHYEEGERLEYCNMPKKIQQKIEKKSKLTKTEEQIQRGLTEIVSDMKKDKSDRIEWMMNWKEDFEYAEEEAEIQAKLARIVKEEDVPKKRGPGRPKKEEGITVLNVQVPIKRKPGRPKKSADITMPLDVEDVVVVKKKGPGRPKKADKEKFEHADEKKAKKEKSSKKYEMMNVDHESDIATGDDEDDRDYPRCWTREDVAEWLPSIGAAYRQYKTVFVDNGVDGKVLLGIIGGDNEERANVEMEETLKVKSAIHRAALISAARKLRGEAE